MQERRICQVVSLLNFEANRLGSSSSCCILGLDNLY